MRDTVHAGSIGAYVQISLEPLAVAHLQDCERQLHRCGAEPLRLFLAARSVHLAFTTALTAAVAGSASVGAYPPKARAEWLRFFELRRTKKVEPPAGDRVMSFADLLKEAEAGAVGWFNAPLQLSDDQSEKVERLTTLRHWTEHPRPHFHFIERAFIASAILTGLDLAEECLAAVAHRLDDVDTLALKDVGLLIRSACLEICA